MVLLNRVLDKVPSVVMDSASGMAQVVDHLAALGHRDCAYLNGPGHGWSNEHRRIGLREAAGRGGVAIREFGPFEPTFAGGILGAEAAVGSGVTAIIAYNDLMALGVLSALAARGVAVPARMSVTGFDDILYAGMCGPPLTTVALPMESAGRTAVELLLDRLSSTGEANGTQRELPTELILRATTAAPAD